MDIDNGAMDIDNGVVYIDNGVVYADKGAMDADNGAMDADNGAMDADNGTMDADNGVVYVRTPLDEFIIMVSHESGERKYLMMRQYKARGKVKWDIKDVLPHLTGRGRRNILTTKFRKIVIAGISTDGSIRELNKRYNIYNALSLLHDLRECAGWQHHLCRECKAMTPRSVCSHHVNT
jgi:hypothetical protein